VNEVRELRWVTKEENRRIICNNIPVALRSPELDRETSRITSTVVRSRLSANSGKSNRDWARLASLEDVCHAEVI
jgi:hypothetical protein